MYYWSYTENPPVKQDVDIGKLGPMWPPMPSNDGYGHKYTEAGQFYHVQEGFKALKISLVLISSFFHAEVISFWFYVFEKFIIL